MAAALFLKVDGATGESKNAKYTGWTECESYSWEGQQRSSMSSGGGGGVGLAALGDLVVTATMDKVYPGLALKNVNGTHVPKVTLAAAKMGGSQIEYMKAELTDVLVTNCRTHGTKGGEMVVEYGFSASKIHIEYWEQTKDGAQGASTSMDWDIKANT
jgi:type VI secretion system secreted protein Hcp